MRVIKLRERHKVTKLSSCIFTMLLLIIIFFSSAAMANGDNIQLRITNHVPYLVEFEAEKNICGTKYPAVLKVPGKGFVFVTPKKTFQYGNCGSRSGGITYRAKDDHSTKITIAFQQPGNPLSKESVVCQSGNKYRLWNCAGNYGGFGRSSIELK